MAEPRARVFEYRVTTDDDWTAHSDRGGSGIARERAWTPEHLLLASLTRCTLTSLQYHARRAEVTFTSSADAHATVTSCRTGGTQSLLEHRVEMTKGAPGRFDRGGDGRRFDVRFSEVGLADVVTRADDLPAAREIWAGQQLEQGIVDFDAVERRKPKAG